MHASSVSDCARAGAIAIDLVQGAVSFVRGAMAGTRMRRTCTHLVRNPAYCTVRCPCQRAELESLDSGAGRSTWPGRVSGRVCAIADGYVSFPTKLYSLVYVGSLRVS